MLRRDLASALIVSSAAAVMLSDKSQAQTCSAPCYAQTAAETAAGVTPTNSSYPELNVMRYGAATTNSGVVNATAFGQCIAVLSHHTEGEMLIPAGSTFNITQALFSGMSAFNVRCDGVLQSSAAQPGSAFSDGRSSYQGLYSPLKFVGCTHFKIYGNGYINPGYVEPMYIVSCSNFDIALDARGTGLNSTLSGFFVQNCFQFRCHDMTVDSITAQNMSASSEIYYLWLNNIQLLQCYDFVIDGWLTRRAGMNGIYVSACYDFAVINCVSEFNSGSGIQVTWVSGVSINGVSTPVRYKINNNTFRYNQADGIDAANTSGITVTVNAQFNNNLHSFNGWCNCDPANPGGADGSGVGTFGGIAGIESIGNVVVECHNAGIWVNSCNNWRISNNTITKTNAGTAQAGVSIISSSNGTLSNNDVFVSASIPALVMQPVADVKLIANNFNGGSISLAGGSYAGCKFSGNSVSSPTVITVPFDFLDNHVSVTGGSQDGLYVVNPSVKVQRNVVSSALHCIVVPTVSYVDVSDNACTSGSGSGIYVSGSYNSTVRGNTCNATGTAAISVVSSCAYTEMSNNRGNSSGGNSFLVDSTCTSTNKWGNVTIAGVPNFSGTYGINF